MPDAAPAVSPEPTTTSTPVRQPPTPFATPVQVPLATPPAKGPPSTPTPAPTAEPTPWVFVPIEPRLPVWPADRRTGDQAVDRVLEAVMSGSEAALMATVEYGLVPCVAPRPVTGRPPFCRDGEAVGTPGRFFFAGGTEGWYYREGEPLPSETMSWVLQSGPRLVAVHNMPELPTARLAIVLANTLGVAGMDRSGCDGVALFIGETGLIGQTGGCEPRAWLLPEDATYLVLPLPEAPR